MRRPLRVWLAVAVALVGAIECGGGRPLPVGNGANAGHGDGAGGSGGTAGGGVVSTPCGALDEASCNTRGDCRPQYCQGCSNIPTFTACRLPGQSIACPATECPAIGPCDTLDETSCMTRTDCKAEYCPDCDGGQRFGLCAGPNEAVACLGCPAPTFCNGLDETSCAATSGCQDDYCPNCDGGQSFVGCSYATNGGFGCPATCPAPASCSTVTPQAACDARTDCHSVFGTCLTCDCAAPGCPMFFAMCADGAQASCNGPTGNRAVLCMALPPACEGPAFVVSYTATCYEGCVRPTECGP